MWSVPELCGVCDTPVANSAAVRCGGPCGMSFHTLCVDVPSNSSDALAAITGSCWYCPGCWPEMQPLLQASTRSHSREAGNERRLPPEMWERIFEHLDCLQLLKIRRTCQYWRSIVDGCRKITNRFTVRFPPCVIMDQRYNPLMMHLIPAAAKASFCSTFWSTVVTVDSWWPTIGPGLTHLNMGKSETSLATFVAMLRQTPNLELIETGKLDHEADTFIDVDFRLTKLKQLSIQSKISDYVFDFFQHIIPFLKRFIIGEECLEDEDQYQSLLKFIVSVKHSLEELDFYGYDDILLEICKVENLRLKNISLRYLFEDDDLLEITRLQPYLRNIFVYSGTVKNEILCGVGQQSPELKRISFVIYYYSEPETVMVPSFLNTMPGLESIELEACEPNLQFNLEGIKNEHMTKFSLTDIETVGNSLQRYFQQSPKLTTVNFENCSFHSWADVLNTLLCIKLLEDLSLSYLKVKENGSFTPPLEVFKKLKRLKLESCDFRSEVFKNMVSLCPILHELSVQNCGVLTVDRQMKTLKKLTICDRLSKNRVSFERLCVGSIVQFCRELEELRICRANLGDFYVGKLQKAFGGKLILFD